MSDAIRSYSSSAGNLRARRRRPAVFRYVFLGALLFAFVWFLWTTRDTHDLGELVPADRQYEIYIADLLGGREAIVDSTLWELVPEEYEAGTFRESVANDLGVPAWILNNYVHGLFHISGDGLPEYQRAVVMTRITRVGAMLERLRGWTDEIEDDYAGGLRLRHVPAAGIHYAIRGRVLLLSQSRDALIHALTLQPGNTLGQDAIDETVENMGDELLLAQIDCEEWELAAPHLDAVELRLWLKGGISRVWMAAKLTDDSRALLRPVLDQAAPGRLAAAPPGPLQISANFGKPLPKVLDALLMMTGSEQDLANTLDALFPEEARPFVGPARDNMFANLGDAWSLGWRGINPDEMLPLPKVAAVVEARSGWTRAWIDQIPAVPASVPAWESWPRTAADPPRVYIPAMAGPDLEPTFANWGPGLLIASSHLDALDLIRAGAHSPWLEEEGTLWARLNPTPILDDIAAAGSQFATAGLLRDLDAQSFDALMSEWRATAVKIAQVELRAEHENGIVTTDLRLTTASE